jgi:hypothetical protein
MFFFYLRFGLHHVSSKVAKGQHHLARFDVPEPKDRAEAEASTRTGLIAGLAGLAALGGLAITVRTYRLTQQGHLTERYTTAIAQLGDDKLDIRLGGIYALERLAVDSRRDHPTVVEGLGAFVRERTDPARTDMPTVTQVLQALLHKPDDAPTSPVDRPAPVPPRPAPDVQAVLTVLGWLPARVQRGNRA